MIDEWVMVPREPGDEMLDAAQGESDLYRLDLVRAYRAMLDAAPAAPVQQAEPVGYFQRDCDYFEQVEDVYQWDADVIPLYLHPPAAEVQLLRDAVAKLSTIVRVPNAEHIADEHNAAVAFLRRALEGGE